MISWNSANSEVPSLCHLGGSLLQSIALTSELSTAEHCRFTVSSYQEFRTQNFPEILDSEHLFPLHNICIQLFPHTNSRTITLPIPPILYDPTAIGNSGSAPGKSEFTTCDFGNGIGFRHWYIFLFNFFGDKDERGG